MITHPKSRLKMLLETLVISLSLTGIVVHSSFVFLGLDELSGYQYSCFDDLGAPVECT